MCTGADQSVVILSLAILDPAPAGGVVKLALVLATLLLAAEDEGAVLFFGVAKAEAMPDTSNSATTFFGAIAVALSGFGW